MTAPAYYNEHDRYAAAWLRNLIAARLIPAGHVDERSIVDVRPADLDGYGQCHFFAGLGGWPYACRLAGWPDKRPIWTGSCPCQPFSVAGKGAGADDPRHLWPHLFRLIRAGRPLVLMGEQVAGAAGYGWFDGVRADLALEDYACRGVDVPACAVDAPHIRSRLYWVAVADADAAGRDERTGACHFRAGLAEPADRCRVADADEPRSGEARQQRGRQLGGVGGDPGHRPNGTFWSDAEWLAGADGKSRRAQPGIRLLVNGAPARVGRLRAYGNAIVAELATEVIAAFLDDECERAAA